MNPAESRARRGRLLGNVLFASLGCLALRFLLGPLRLKALTSMLSPEEYGELSLISLTVSFVTMASSLGSLEFLLRKLPGRDPQYQQAVFKTVLYYFGLLALGLAAVGGALLLVFPPASVRLGTLDVIACGALLVLTVHLTQYTHYLFGVTRYTPARLLQVVYSDGWFLPLLLFVWLGGLTTSHVLWIWVAWMAVAFVIGQRWIALRQVWQHPATRAGLREILVFGVPLVPMILGDWLFRVQDRYVLAWFLDLTAVANYNLCIQIAMVGALVGYSVLDILMTEFFRMRNVIPGHDRATLAADGGLRRAFSTMLRYTAVLMVPMIAIVWFCAPAIITILSDPRKYLAAAPLLAWTAGIPLFTLLVMVFGRVMVALERGRVVGWATLAAAGLNLALSVLLIPRLQGAGAALANTLSLAALAIYFGWEIRGWRWVDRRNLRPVRLALFGGLTLLGFYAATQWVPLNNFVALGAGCAWSLGLMFGLGLVTKADLEIVHPPAAVAGEPVKQD